MSDPVSAWKQAISKHKPRKVHGAFWYRAIINTRRDSLLSPYGAYLNGGRYNAAREFGAVYLSESPEGCRAEMTKRLLTPLNKYVVGKIRTYAQKICDLTDEDLLDELGLDRDQLVSDDLERTQLLGTLIRDAGFEGILAPSAAGDFANLIIFKDRLSGSSKVKLIDVKPM